MLISDPDTTRRMVLCLGVACSSSKFRCCGGMVIKNTLCGGLPSLGWTILDLYKRKKGRWWVIFNGRTIGRRLEMDITPHKTTTKKQPDGAPFTKTKRRQKVLFDGRSDSTRRHSRATLAKIPPPILARLSINADATVTSNEILFKRACFTMETCVKCSFSFLLF